MSRGNWEDLDGIKRELSGIVKFIDATRRGLDSLENTVKLSSEKFPEASVSIKAVAGDLEEAANRIMTILEGTMTDQEQFDSTLAELAQWAGKLPETSAEAGLKMLTRLRELLAKQKGDTMEIFSNMSFHDLSGQKLKKVVASLATVEAKLLELAINFGMAGDEDKKNEFLAEIKNSANQQVPLKQDIVDKLLKELGHS